VIRVRCRLQKSLGTFFLPRPTHTLALPQPATRFQISSSSAFIPKSEFAFILLRNVAYVWGRLLPAKAEKGGGE